MREFASQNDRKSREKKRLQIKQGRLKHVIRLYQLTYIIKDVSTDVAEIVGVPDSEGLHTSVGVNDGLEFEGRIKTVPEGIDHDGHKGPHREGLLRPMIFNPFSFGGEDEGPKLARIKRVSEKDEQCFRELEIVWELAEQLPDRIQEKDENSGHDLPRAKSGLIQINKLVAKSQPLFLEKHCESFD